ncbi:NucA/NucB deoxyribonuclease domain-containing protein [Streptomyces sp. RS10V-4]|uniref:NucA/NucB deoxyribonuclease domain-containing protein n=1 Tax=Streptomyces rhizoryzae TaxID=2932493 RepID=UPI0020060EC0|nr:NucA/NucB deoxyribonuclease domain-containing protein [Streptomyces rhizoryzae]MCK7627786.1 NucA/NucB deoxyribonuclease domain-containing protein [Streptomyces rhizoryzae]
MTHHIAIARKARLLVVAGALILAGSPPVANAATNPASASFSSKSNLTFVSAATLPPDTLRRLNNPVPLDRYRPEKTAAPALEFATGPSRVPVTVGSEETDLREQCAKQKEAAASKGWLKSRFETCQKRPFDLVLRDTKGTQEIGRLWFDMWVLGFATDGARRVDYVSSIENIRVQTAPGSGADARNWTVGQYFSHTSGFPSDPSSVVTGPKEENRDELLGAWDKKPQWTLTYTSPDSGPQWSKGNLQLATSLVMAELTVNAPGVKPYKQVDAYHSNVRFDYAGPTAGKHKGTVFSEGRAELKLSLKDPAVKESAQHILDAQEHPERTFPSWPGKSVPGAKEPLHRLIDINKQKENREKSIKECAKVWGDYSGTPLQCDEYPFASTREGSGKGDDRYSVRLIDGKDNETGGNRLNLMYTANRILDGDPFFVTITS